MTETPETPQDRDRVGPARPGPTHAGPTCDWLTHRARTSPEKTALIEAADAVQSADASQSADGTQSADASQSANGTEWSYAELDAAVETTAGRLSALGVQSGDHLGVLMETRVAFVRLVHAAMRLGAVLVPLNARLAEPELARQAEVADLHLLVCEAETEADAVAIAEVPVASVDSSGDEGKADDEEMVAALDERDPADFDPASWSRSESMAMLFTSGTTGDPKAVELSMGNFLASATSSAFRLGVTPDDRWLLCLSMYHMGGLSVVLRSALYGTTVVLQEGFDAEAAVEAIDEYEVAGVSLVPTMLRRMLDRAVESAESAESVESAESAAESNGSEGLADSLRFVLLGGAPAREELLSRTEELGVPVHPTYGMTETTSQIATARPREAFEHRGTVGRPLLWTDVTVVGEGEDDEGKMEPVPAGETGELVVSGPTVMRGYYGDSAATDEAFGEYGLHTGDVGYRDQTGRIWVLNRREDRIVTGGENVHPGEVVEALREHPGVRDAAVVGIADEEWGERVAALVVPEESANLSVEGIEDHCRDFLAGYKRPRTVAFSEELPRTSSGTVKREAIREILREEGERSEGSGSES